MSPCSSSGEFWTLTGTLQAEGPVVELAVKLDGGTDDDLRGLLRWLRDEDDLRGTRMTLLDAEAGEGDMGAVLDLLMVVLGSGGAGVVLLRSIGSWLHARGSDMTVTVTAKDGVATKLDIKRLREPHAAVEIIKALQGETDRGPA